jgi:hypothetical protein
LAEKKAVNVVNDPANVAFASSFFKHCSMIWISQAFLALTYVTKIKIKHKAIDVFIVLIEIIENHL